MKVFKAIGALWLSRKLWTMVSAVAVLWLVHERSIMLLYTFTEAPQITAFQAITLATLTAIAAIVTAYMGIQGFAKSTLTQLVETSQTATFSRAEVVDEQIVRQYADKFREDPSYRPVTPDAGEVFR